MTTAQNKRQNQQINTLKRSFVTNFYISMIWWRKCAICGRYITAVSQKIGQRAKIGKAIWYSYNKCQWECVGQWVMGLATEKIWKRSDAVIKLKGCETNYYRIFTLSCLEWKMQCHFTFNTLTCTIWSFNFYLVLMKEHLWKLRQSLCAAKWHFFVFFIFS